MFVDSDADPPRQTSILSTSLSVTSSGLRGHDTNCTISLVSEMFM